MKKIHIVFSAFGTKGDIHPMLGLAKKISQAGFDVSFMANDYYKELVIQHGVEFASLGSVELYHSYFANDKVWVRNQTDNQQHFFDNTKPNIKIGYEFVEALVKKGKRVIVVTLSINANGARMAADALGLPGILISLAPQSIPSLHMPSAPTCWLLPKWMPKFIRPTFLFCMEKMHEIALNRKSHTNSLNLIRKGYGLKKAIPNARQKSFLHLGLFPAWYAPRPKDWPADLKLVGFPLFDIVNQQARDFLDNFIVSHGSPIVFTTGTGVKDATTIYQEGKRICEALNIPGIFIGGEKGKDLLENSPLCMHINYVDFEYTLPKCKAIVHHGGIGTTAQAIRAGIPQLIRPLAFDQPDNANRVHNLGVGTFVFPEAFTAENVAPILRILIDGAENNRQLKMYSADVRRSNALDKACDIIINKIKELKDVEPVSDSINLTMEAGNELA